MDTYLLIIAGVWLLVLIFIVMGIKIDTSDAPADERLGAIIPFMVAIGLTVVNVINMLVYFAIRMYLSH
jgi:hypothetical protein